MLPGGSQILRTERIRNMDGTEVDAYVVAWRDEHGYRQSYFSVTLPHEYLGEVV